MMTSVLNFLEDVLRWALSLYLLAPFLFIFLVYIGIV